MKTIKKENWDSEEIEKEGYMIFDWEENPNDVIEEIDKKLQEFGLEIEEFDTESDCFAYKIIKLNNPPIQ